MLIDACYSAQPTKPNPKTGILEQQIKIVLFNGERLSYFKRSKKDEGFFPDTRGKLYRQPLDFSAFDNHITVSPHGKAHVTITTEERNAEGGQIYIFPVEVLLAQFKEARDYDNNKVPEHYAQTVYILDPDTLEDTGISSVKRLDSQSNALEPGIHRAEVSFYTAHDKYNQPKIAVRIVQLIAADSNNVPLAAVNG